MFKQKFEAMGKFCTDTDAEIGHDMLWQGESGEEPPAPGAEKVGWNTRGSNLTFR